MLFNPFAAIPSMHVAFALMLGVTMAQHRAPALGAGAVVGYAPVVTFVVVATANHWWLDGFLGAVVALVSARLRARAVRARAARGVGVERAPPAGARAAIVFAADDDPTGRAPAAPDGARVPGADAQPPDRVAPDAERDLAHGLRPLRGRRRAGLGGVFLLGGIAFIVGSVCDTLDGRYSRMSGKGSPFGAFLDSTLDRIEEGVVLTAVAAHFSREGDDLAVAAVVVAVLASLMVSYTRARAEALGVECKVGIADRAVRVVILSAGLVFADLGPARAGRLRARRAVDDHRLPAHLARPRGADAPGRGLVTPRCRGG